MDTSIWLQILTLIIFVIIVSCKDYYEILGVKRDASDKDIKKRFRQLGISNNISLHHTSMTNF